MPAPLSWRGGRRTAWLYRIELALPKRTPTLAQEAVLDAAMAKRQTCQVCRRRYFACLPLRTLGHCDACEGGYIPSPDTVMHDPTPSRIPPTPSRISPVPAANRPAPAVLAAAG
ncbi:RRQRL motif-containing zinc-binding protein [Streptomyces sp. NPDC006552]|uniref:RRQRL motif-containing zinc-binding protein n=1 Tax=Streptomyces sp. NPDC006552 TaxID=3157179 RepID=UPI0033AFB639